jgi:hypothetical protein
MDAATLEVLVGIRAGGKVGKRSKIGLILSFVQRV